MTKSYRYDLLLFGNDNDDEFWESIAGQCGADEITKYLRELLDDTGIEYNLILREFKHDTRYNR
jgi:hypothetical protein